jgi:hypothetical protein
MSVATPRLDRLCSSEGVSLAVENNRGEVQVQAEAEAKRSGAMHAHPVPLHACCRQPRQFSGATSSLLQLTQLCFRAERLDVVVPDLYSHQRRLSWATFRDHARDTCEVATCLSTVEK